MRIKTKHKINIVVLGKFLKKNNLNTYEFCQIFGIDFLKLQKMLIDGASFDDLVTLAGVLNVKVYDLIAK